MIPARYPGIGEPWEPSKLYYDRAFSPDRFRALHFALEEAGVQSPYAERLAAWLEADAEGHTPPPPTHPTTTQIECGDFFEARDEALRAHRTQVDPEGFFFAVSADLQRKRLAVGGLLPDRVPDPGGTARKGPVCRAKIDRKGLFYPA